MEQSPLHSHWLYPVFSTSIVLLKGSIPLPSQGPWDLTFHWSCHQLLSKHRLCNGHQTGMEPKSWCCQFPIGCPEQATPLGITVSINGDKGCSSHLAWLGAYHKFMWFTGHSAPICNTVPVCYHHHYPPVLGQAEGKRRGWSIPHSLVRMVWAGRQQDSLGKELRTEPSRESCVYPH